jgi:NAD(P)-dependent dehydrogenase (short-subunit alcohol dehydrogenase family)
MTIRYDDRVAIVTGAGAGLGREHALLLASRGARVVVNDPGGSVEGTGSANSAADRVVAEIVAAGGEAVANYASVADREGANSIIATAVDKWGRLDILVNNAGILRDKSFHKMEISDFEFVVQVHLMGTVFCTQAAWPVMRAQKYGRVVVTTSISGTLGNFGQTNYGAAKMGVLGLINCLRQEGASYNILTNAISPAARTRMTEALLPESVLEWLKPELVSPAVAWLCSEECNISGEVIAASAGSYSVVRYVQSDGVQFDPGEPVTIEMFAEALPKITDLSSPEPHAGNLRKLEDRLRAIGRIK